MKNISYFLFLRTIGMYWDRGQTTSVRNDACREDVSRWLTNLSYREDASVFWFFFQALKLSIFINMWPNFEKRYECHYCRNKVLLLTEKFRNSENFPAIFL